VNKRFKKSDFPTYVFGSGSRLASKWKVGYGPASKKNKETIQYQITKYFLDLLT